jgi:TM2 domain-containing membrane protein YozV
MANTLEPGSQLLRESTKSYQTTWLLSLLLGFVGADRFYLGQWKFGVLKLGALLFASVLSATVGPSVISWGPFLALYLFDLWNAVFGRLRDSQGLPVSKIPEKKLTQQIVSGGVSFIFVVNALAGAASGLPPTIETIEEPQGSCLPIPDNYSKLEGAEKEVVDWALGKVHNHFENPEKWCDFEYRAFRATSPDKSSLVSFNFWTDYDLASTETYELTYEICTAFVEPFDTHGVRSKFRGNRLTGTVRIDGVAETKVSPNEQFMDGVSGDDSDDRFRRGCGAVVFFPKVAAELESKGWKAGGGVQDKRFGGYNFLSERDDFYCQNKRCK